MAVAQIIQTIVGVVGSIIGAIGQSQDQTNQDIAANAAKSQQRQQPIKAAAIGSSDENQASMLAPSSKAADYARSAASQPSLMTQLGGYIGSGGDVVQVAQQIGGFHANADATQAAASAKASNNSTTPGGSTTAIGTVDPGAEAQGQTGMGMVQPPISAEGKQLGLEGKSYVGAEDYLQSLHQGFGGMNGNQ